MLDLAEIPFFAALPAESIARIRALIPVQHYAQGTIIARIGEPGRYFQAVAAGAVRVQPDPDAAGGWRGFILGPGQIFGEMSLFTGMPVAATVIAARDTATYCLDGEAFLRLLDDEPLLHRSLTRLLIDRLRYRTRNEGRKPALAVVTCADRGFDLARFARVLGIGIQHYAPGSELVGLTPGDSLDEQGVDTARIETWRRDATSEQYLVTAIRPGALRELTPLLMPEDVVLELGTPSVEADDTTTGRTRAGAADYTRVLVGTEEAHAPGRWSFRVSGHEVERAAQMGAAWTAREYPHLDHVARHVTFCEVGIALSSGAARGFAHLGVLETLEAHGIPIDFLAGTSMGGITALTVAHAGSAREGAARMREMLGGNKRIRDAVRFPRESLFTGHKVATAARQVFGDATFADLRLPAAVVASDLVSGERAVIDSGPVVPAVLGTSAIPGFFPPIASGPLLLVDGAIVSRVPVDILDRRRCGLRIAVNVVALPKDDPEFNERRHARLQMRSQRTLGLKHVLAASWELLGAYGSSLEALRADLVITPATHDRGGAFDFDRCEAMIECGRTAALARIDAICDTVRAMLGTGYR